MAGTLSFKEAKQLAEDQHSCVKVEIVNRKVNLPFRYVQCAKKGIQEILDNELNLYSESLEGAMIAYQKVRLCQQMGRIVECQPFLQFNVKVDVAVFRPYKDAVMKGVINKIGNDHIGVLIHSTFNGSLRRPRDLDVTLSVGQEVYFTVWKVYQHGGLTAVRGDLDLDSLGELPGREVDTTDSVLPKFEINIPDNTADTTISSSGDGKKLKRKRSVSSADELDTTLSSVKDEPGLLSPTKHKKRKRRQKEESETTVSVDVKVEPGLSLSEKKRKRKKDKSAVEESGGEHKAKKRKRSMSVSDLDTTVATSVQEGGDHMTSAKKVKRRKKDKHKDGDVSAIEESAQSIKPAESASTSFIGSPPIARLFEQAAQNETDFSSPTPKKKHKDKKKDKIKKELTSTPVIGETLSRVDPETPGFNESSIADESINRTDEPTSSKKKKKKHKKSKDGGLDTTLNDSIVSGAKSDVFAGSDSGISDSTPQSLTESTKKAKKKKKSKGDVSVSV